MGRLGGQIHDFANGRDLSPVRSRLEAEPVKSIGNGETFSRNLTTWVQVGDGVRLLADSVASRLRRHGMYAGGLQITIRAPAFHDRSRQRQLAAPTRLMRELSAAALDLAGTLWTPPNPIRALTITAIHLTAEAETYEQTDLFAAEETSARQRLERLEAAMDGIRQKYGAGAIAFGGGRVRGPEAGGSLQRRV